MDLEGLIGRAAGGDLEAFGEIVGRFQHMAFGSALSLVHELQVAEDVGPGGVRRRLVLAAHAGRARGVPRLVAGHRPAQRVPGAAPQAARGAAAGRRRRRAGR